MRGETDRETESPGVSIPERDDDDLLLKIDIDLLTKIKNINFKMSFN